MARCRDLPPDVGQLRMLTKRHRDTHALRQERLGDEEPDPTRTAVAQQPALRLAPRA
jgi:hypothetical protein